MSRCFSDFGWYFKFFNTDLVVLEVVRLKNYFSSMTRFVVNMSKIVLSVDYKIGCSQMFFRASIKFIVNFLSNK